MADKDPPSPTLEGVLLVKEIAGQARNDGLRLGIRFPNQKKGKLCSLKSTS